MVHEERQKLSQDVADDQDEAEHEDREEDVDEKFSADGAID